MKKSKMEKWIKYYDMGIGIFAIILLGLAIVSQRYNQKRIQQLDWIDDCFTIQINGQWTKKSFIVWNLRKYPKLGIIYSTRSNPSNSYFH